jgi:NTP pyrophosphatase (non-canonical NTP hydrolase)
VTEIYHQLKSPKAQATMATFVFEKSIRFLIEQCSTDSVRWFPETANDIPFLTLAMCGEVGEVANLVKKIARKSHTMHEQQEKLAEEIVDVLIYLCNIMGQMPEEIDWAAVWIAKRAYNEKRFGK